MLLEFVRVRKIAAVADIIQYIHFHGILPTAKCLFIYLILSSSCLDGLEKCVFSVQL